MATFSRFFSCQDEAGCNLPGTWSTGNDVNTLRCDYHAQFRMPWWEYLAIMLEHTP